MKIFKNILISTFILYSFVSYSSIYETCDWTNWTLTSKIIEQTASATSTCTHFDPSGACINGIQEDTSEEDPFILSVFKQLNTYLQETWFNFVYDKEDEDTSHTTNTYKIDNICFLASSIKGKNTFKIRGSQYPCSDYRTNLNQRFYYCDDVETSNSCQTVMPVTDSEGNTRLIYPRAPCLSEDYIQTLSTSFNNMSYCFNLSKKEQNDLFAIIHHESSFMPNSRSSAGAKCSGQLTTRALVNLNMDILLEKNPIYSNYAQAIEKCPYLTDILIPTDLLTNEKYQNKSYEALQSKIENLNFTCTLIADMSRCFFYSFLFHKTSIKLIEQELLPLEKLLTPEDLESFKSFVSYLAYNGGHSITRVQLGRFINNLNCANQEECSSEHLNIENLKQDFLTHLRQTKDKRENHIYSTQTLHYPYAIQRDLDYFQSDFLIQHLLNYRTSPALTVEEITDVSSKIKNNCQF